MHTALILIHHQQNEFAIFFSEIYFNEFDLANYCFSSSFSMFPYKNV